MGIQIINFRKYDRNTLKGFLTIHMSGIGLEIRDATYHEKSGNRWIGLPGKPYEDEDGNTKYSYIVKFVDKDRWEQFQKATLEALDKYLVKKGEQTPDDDIPF